MLTYIIIISFLFAFFSFLEIAYNLVSEEWGKVSFYIFAFACSITTLLFCIEERNEKLGVDENGYYKKQIGNHTFLLNLNDDKLIVHDPDCQCKEDRVKECSTKTIEPSYITTDRCKCNSDSVPKEK